MQKKSELCKRLIVLLLVPVLLFTITACGQKYVPPQNNIPPVETDDPSNGDENNPSDNEEPNEPPAEGDTGDNKDPNGEENPPPENPDTGDSEENPNPDTGDDNKEPDEGDEKDPPVNPDDGEKPPVDPDDKDPEQPTDPTEPEEPDEPEKEIFAGVWRSWVIDEMAMVHVYEVTIDAQGNATASYETDGAESKSVAAVFSPESKQITLTDGEGDDKQTATFVYDGQAFTGKGFAGETQSFSAKRESYTQFIYEVCDTFAGTDATYEYSLEFSYEFDYLDVTCTVSENGDDTGAFLTVYSVCNEEIILSDDLQQKQYRLQYDFSARTLTFAETPSGAKNVVLRKEDLKTPPAEYAGAWSGTDGEVPYALTLNADGSFSLYIQGEQKTGEYTVSFTQTSVLIVGKDTIYGSARFYITAEGKLFSPLGFFGKPILLEKAAAQA